MDGGTAGHGKTPNTIVADAVTPPVRLGVVIGVGHNPRSVGKSHTNIITTAYRPLLPLLTQHSTTQPPLHTTVTARQPVSPFRKGSQNQNAAAYRLRHRHTQTGSGWVVGWDRTGKRGIEGVKWVTWRVW